MPKQDPNDDVPAYHQLINPTLTALHHLGGSGSITEIVDHITEQMQLPEDILTIPHGKGSSSEVEYRAAWARTYLKKAGLIDNSSRGVWALTKEGLATKKVDTRKLVRKVGRMARASREGKAEPASPDASDASTPDTDSWRAEALAVLQSMDPYAFERLCQRLLREAGFIEVEVTKRSADGGIDGHGTIRIGGLISFNVLFQSKRYQGSIGASIVRDFRGAMVGRADKGLLITTGSFTREARKEATRDGAPPIDLIDGELLLDKLKELELGIIVRKVEVVEVDREWFEGL